MSNRNGGVCGSDEPRHGNLDRRLSGGVIVVEASGVVAGQDGWVLDHTDRAHSLRVFGAAAGANTEGVVVVGENEGQDERWKELKRKLSLSDSSRLGRVDSWGKDTQQK